MWTTKTTKKSAFFRRTLRGRLHASEPPSNPNRRPRHTPGVHGSGAHAWLMAQRPPNGTNGGRKTDGNGGLASRFLGGKWAAIHPLARIGRWLEPVVSRTCSAHAVSAVRAAGV